VLSALAIVVAIAIADAINPATVAPALYLATTERPLRRLVAFTAAFFAVNFAAGALIVLGPGQLLLSLTPHISADATHWIEVGAGAVLLAVALFIARSQGPGPSAPEPAPGSPSRAAALGAAIAAVELPTAVPYFAALAAIVAADLSLAGQLLLVAVFNVVFVAPVLAMIAMLAAAGPSAALRLRRFGEALRARWRPAFALLAGAAGTVLAAFGLLGMR
jgi:cytochrome c biogenesis protein CcdA